MGTQDASRWTVSWLETLEGDELRKLGAALFQSLGYGVADSDSPVLNYVLSQEGPLAPDVGLRCVGPGEGIEVPALRELDAAVANNAYSFGIVAKNGTFRQEEIMFAQGKRIQLINSDEFVKRLGQVPQEKQEELIKQFNPTVPAPASAAPGAPGARIVAGDDHEENGSGTPDFIKKLASVPGFGQKPGAENPVTQAQAQTPAAPSPSPSPASSTKPDAAPAGGVEQKLSGGLNLIKNVTEPEASSPPAVGTTLPSLSDVLPQIKVPANQPAAPAPGVPAPPAPLAPPAANPATVQPTTLPATPPRAIPTGRPPAAAPSGADKPVATASTPPPIPKMKAKNESGAGQNESKKETAAERLNKLAEQSSMATQVAAAKSIASKVSDESPAPENKGVAEGDKTPAESGGKKTGSRVLKFAIAAALILSIAGGAVIAKIVVGKLTAEEKIEPAPVAPVSQPVAPDPEKVAALEKSLDRHLTDLKHVSTQMDARENALRLASISANAMSAGSIDFVKIGGATVEGAIAAITEGAAIDDPKHLRSGERFEFGELDEKDRELAANYLRIEEGVLKFVIDGTEPSTPQYDDEPAKSGKKMLADLETILNGQHIVASRNNARKIADIAASAREGGLDFTSKGRRGIERTIEVIVEGETVKNYMNSGEDIFFGMPNLSKKAQSAAAGYLTLDEEGVHFVENPDPLPDPAFDLIGTNLIADLERGTSIAEKAVAHVGGRIENLNPQLEELEKKLETILALTGEPVEIPFADGRLTMLLPRDFVYEHEDQQTVLIVPKFTSAEGNAWLRIKLDKALKQENIYPNEGDKFLKALAAARGRPIEHIGGKVCYWDREEFFNGEQLYRVMIRFVGFGNSIVSVTDATAEGMEDVPDATRLQKILPAIIGSLREVNPLAAARNRETAVPAEGPPAPPAAISGHGPTSAAKARLASP